LKVLKTELIFTSKNLFLPLKCRSFCHIGTF